ncbi:MAG: tyrosine-type recombinase/integrase [SAR324 cluster bacterium]|uniref:Tyrosine-type recombinase/integrase n=1 Tax=SAR324 cluster bacterium TaxID=2024889 RepID=A0A7X9FQN3_9DELT|nr:tyrosine-type recombinase/integrase [SAR324 cluster bacterium]
MIEPATSLSLKDIEKTPLHSVIEYYIHYYASGSSHTAKAKQLDLQHFLNFLQSLKGYSKVEKLKLADWDHASVQRFVEDSLNHGEAPTSVARRLATLKHMGRTLSERFPGFINPAREVKSPKLRALVPKALEPDEIKAIREKAQIRLKEKSSFNRLRNQVLFDFMLDTGLRADEVRLLKLSQIDPDLEWIQSVRTKGKQYRNVYITSSMRPRLKKYLEARSQQLKRFYAKLSNAQDKALPLFISTYNANASDPGSFLMGAKSIWRAINELSRGTGLHPHLLRHSYAIDLLKSTNDVRLVAQALGHSDVRITMRYTERAQEDIAKALEKARRRNP